MTAIVDVVLPIFAIMLAGYGAGRFGFLGEANSEALNGFVFYGALPAWSTGASVFVIAQRYGIYVQRSTAAIMVAPCSAAA